MRTLLIALFASGAAAAASHAFSDIPLFFVPAADGAGFAAHGSGLTASFTAAGVDFRAGGAAFGITFEGANAHCRVEGTEPLAARVNFLRGERSAWRTDLPAYGAIIYRDLYPGIDMVYGGSGSNLKSEFVIRAGADPARIRLRYTGTDRVRIDGDGTLAIPAEGQELHEQAPVAYQERNGDPVSVPVRFSLEAGGSVGFIVTSYDASLPLVIDPVLVYSTLFGGSSTDAVLAMAVDSTGSVYVTGYTASTDIPATNPAQNLSGGGNDVFVAKLNAAGSALVYCTYLGGTGDDRAYGIAIDAAGEAFVTGSTASKNFPVHTPIQTKLAGAKNVFVVKLNAAGNALVYGTYLGGAGSDIGYAIAVDATGNAYIAGDTTSSGFPATGFQTGYHGAQDGFVAKINASGTALVYSTFLGGSGIDHVAGIAIDSNGAAYVTGSTYSTDFPAANAYQPSNAGGQDAFIAKLSVDGSTLAYSTYFGGSGGAVSYPEAGQAIAVDSSGNAYIAGVTSSANFPVIQPYQSSLNGWEDAFVLKLSSVGWPLYSTYLGGSGVDMANAIAVDEAGNAYVAGYTYSTDLPVVNPVQSAIASPGDIDAFLAIVNAGGSSLSFLTYLGGTAPDTATSVGLDGAGGIYIAGWTQSTNFPLLHPLQSVNGGNYGAFIAKLQQLGLSISCTHTGSFTQGQSGSYTVTVSNASIVATSGAVTVTDTVTSGMTVSSIVGTGWNCSGATCTRNDALAAGGNYPALTVTVAVGAAAASPQQNTAMVTGGGDLSSHTAVDAAAIASNPTFSISGTVTHGAAGVSGVTVALTGGATSTATTSSAGAYNFAALPQGGNYTVTPKATNYLFSPTSQAVSGLAANQTFNFTATANLAQSKTATQSGAYGSATASLAVDGNTDGVYKDGSVAITGYVANAWWQVDLGSSTIPSTIAIWGRTDCCASNLSDYWVFVSDTPFLSSDTPATLASRANTWSSHQTTAPLPETLIAVSGATGRYVRVQLTGTGYLEMAEVQVFGTVNTAAPVDLAQGMMATESGTYGSATASLSVDGNTDGVYADGSVSISGYATNAWWQVDLGTSSIVSSIALWGRTDCCASNLSDYWVFVSDTPFSSTDTPATLQSRANTWSSHQTTAPTPETIIAASGATGRYVRVQLTGSGYLEMAEVQVFGTVNTAAPVNLSKGMTAAQSSTFSTYTAANAVDGNTDGVFADGSLSITNYAANSWWQVDLGGSATLSSIVLWGRTDCCGSWLGDYWVFVSNTPFLATDTPATLASRANTWSSHQTSAPSPSMTISATGVTGRYVRVQLTGTNYLEMAEVQVMGASQ